MWTACGGRSALRRGPGQLADPAADRPARVIGLPRRQPHLASRRLLPRRRRRAGLNTTSLIVNSHNILIDHIWAWRGDNGSGVGWTVNPADTGVIVNGNNVTALGLFVEHYQKCQVIWNGNGGRTGNGVITNVINTTGAPAQGTATVPSNVVSYP